MNLNIRKNAIFSIGEAASIAVCYFVIFRIVVKDLGVDALGVWSLVAATAAMARLGDAGLSAGVTKYIATSTARLDYIGARRYLDTGIISVAALYTLLAAIIFAASPWILPMFVSGESLATAKALIPISLFTLVVNGAAAVSNSAIIGTQRGYVKSALSVFSTILLVAISASLVPKLGILALGLAQLAQSAVLLVGSVALLSQPIKAEGLLPQWSNKAFREMLSYGAQLQVGSISALIYEPAMKAVMVKFGGLPALAHYEVALRVVMLSRNFIVSANQSLTAAFANMVELRSTDLGATVRKAYKFTCVASVAMFAIISASSYPLSLIIFHEVSINFVALTVILAAAQSVNTTAVPFYMLGLGSGKLRYNVISHLCVTILSPAAGALLGNQFGPIGVAIGCLFGLCIGAIVLYVGYINYFRPITLGSPPLRSA